MRAHITSSRCYRWHLHSSAQDWEWKFWNQLNLNIQFPNTQLYYDVNSHLIYKNHLYLPYILVNVSLLIDTCDGVLEVDSLSSVKKPDRFGWGIEPSPRNMKSTDDILGLSSARCCTHNKPTVIDRVISETLHDPPKNSSAKSSDLPSL